MDVKAVIKNIFNKGIGSTWEIYKKRRSPQSGTKVQSPKKSSREYIHMVAQDEFEIAEKIFRSLRQVNKEDNLSNLKDTLEQMDTAYKDALKKVYEKDYKNGIKAIFIKEILPQLYNVYREAPVEDKVIILQQRKSLNSSCTNIYDRLVSDGKYEVKFHELNFTRHYKT